MISKNNLKYLLKIRKIIKSFKNAHTIDMYKSKMKSLLDRYVKKNLLFFEIKIYFKEEDLRMNPNLKIYNIIDEFNKKIIEKIKLMEFIYVNGEIKNKNNLYVKLLIGVKSIIGYNKLLLKRYRYKFRNNKNIKIKYLSNSKKIEKVINKILIFKDPRKQRFIYKHRVNIGSEEDQIIPDLTRYNDFHYKISNLSYWQSSKLPDNISDYQLKLDNQFNSRWIVSNKKISVFSLINIWKTYCIINDIYYSDNKLYKKVIYYKEGSDEYKEDKKIEPIEIRINNRVIVINNNIDSLIIDENNKYQKTKYIYIGELDYLIKNLNFIMKFLYKCYSQQINKLLLKKIKKLYLKKAYRLLSTMPDLYLRECGYYNRILLKYKLRYDEKKTNNK